MNPRSWWKNKNIIVTGNTGFKGAWLSLMLESLGANVFGLSDAIKSDHILWRIIDSQHSLNQNYFDIRDQKKLEKFIHKIQPHVIFHLAAEAIVFEATEKPLETISINALGTATLLNSIRSLRSLEAIILVTTDKVYKNSNKNIPFKEDDQLGGNEIYSASKSAAEMIVQGFHNSFLMQENPNLSIATARAGNVIGGGDWGKNRLVPDIFRSLLRIDRDLELRNPESVRPWQHVLDLNFGYLHLAQHLVESKKAGLSHWNFANKDLHLNVLQMVLNFQNQITKHELNSHLQIKINKSLVHESEILTLDISKTEKELGYYSLFNLDNIFEDITSWYLSYLKFDSNSKIYENTIKSIDQYLGKRI